MLLGCRKAGALLAASLNRRQGGCPRAVSCSWSIPNVASGLHFTAGMLRQCPDWAVELGLPRKVVSACFVVKLIARLRL